MSIDREPYFCKRDKILTKILITKLVRSTKGGKSIMRDSGRLILFKWGRGS